METLNKNEIKIKKLDEFMRSILIPNQPIAHTISLEGNI